MVMREGCLVEDVVDIELLGSRSSSLPAAKAFADDAANRRVSEHQRVALMVRFGGLPDGMSTAASAGRTLGW